MKTEADEARGGAEGAWVRVDWGGRVSSGYE